ncbi:unnamed protein product [Ranitomeya imitator]|uniref:Uncharacterized protein n=1 Tax=Ranitomeya imitator TaxID=111125 RepID=A0ABN9LAV0_9NEOB|nr:unnamed protein product [Ranitomeya imitator]
MTGEYDPSPRTPSFYVTPEEQLRRLVYCTKLLLSPIDKKEVSEKTKLTREKRKREEEEMTLRELLDHLAEEKDKNEKKEEGDGSNEDQTGH